MAAAGRVSARGRATQLVVLRELVDEESLGTVVEAASGTGLADLAADAGSASPEVVRALKERMAEDGWTIR
ncbi:hypothetical protein QFZ82_002602 [Streptomyces sp. V4I23]|uniref:hypothetical protein n=1 Tax=Streptomyces sp. V4I23 TaxID=3042282 RepID=UPI00278A31A8|nr:hypothetical protein [Streptomyces sp. V4I23]MDQ1008117.1 hypothetical protein [Streptomyces sp. V4I23]